MLILKHEKEKGLNMQAWKKNKGNMVKKSILFITGIQEREREDNQNNTKENTGLGFFQNWWIISSHKLKMIK